MSEEKKSEGSVPSPKEFAGPTGPGAGSVGAQPQPQKMDWVKSVEAAENMFFIPDEFIDRIKKNDTDRATYNEKLEAMAEKEIDLNVQTQNIFYDIRKALSKKGVKVWMKNIGINAAALRDGKYVINLTSNDKQ